jgi:hypothetical protein
MEINLTVAPRPDTEDRYRLLDLGGLRNANFCAAFAIPSFKFF